MSPYALRAQEAGGPTHHQKLSVKHAFHNLIGCCFIEGSSLGRILWLGFFAICIPGMDPVSIPIRVASASVAAPETIRNGRKGSRKVRTGCITCKLRKVKCDESKPACLRCTKTGRRCDGYLPRTTTRLDSTDTTIKPQACHPANLALFYYSQGPSSGPSLFTGWHPSEKRAFAFYTARSSVNLFRKATTHFWSRIIPSLCFQEPAIRHAAIVLSDLHERGERNYSASAQPIFPSLSPFATSHYVRALRATRNWTPPQAGIFTGSASIAVPLLACAMFIPIGFSCGDEEAGQMHIRLGRRILATFDGNMTSPGAELIRKELVPIFTRVNVASFLFGSPPPRIPPALRWTRTLFESDAPLVFDTASEAEQALNEIMEDGFRFWGEQTDARRQATPQPSAQKAYELQSFLLARLHRWSTALDTLRRIKPLEIDEHTARMNDLYLLTARAFVQRALPLAMEGADDPNSVTFESVIAAAGKIMSLYEERRMQQPTSFTEQETHELSLTDADALELRKQMVMDCYENIWNAWQVIQVTQRAAATTPKFRNDQDCYE